MDIKRRWIAALFAGVLIPAAHASEDTFSGCVDLGADREIVRSGSSEAFLLRNGVTLPGVADPAVYDMLVKFPGAR